MADEINYLKWRLKVVEELDRFDDIFFPLRRCIELSRKYIFDYIDDLQQNINVLVPEHANPSELLDVLIRLKILINKSLKNYTTSLSISYENFLKLGFLIYDFDENSKHTWLTVAFYAYSYKDKMIKWFKEFRKAEQLFNEMVEKYSSLYKF